jgi:predicted ester cyclase
LGIAATDRRIEYARATFFRVRDGRVTDGWGLGDTAAVRAQLAGTTWWEIQGPQSVP